MDLFDNDTLYNKEGNTTSVELFQGDSENGNAECQTSVSKPENNDDDEQNEIVKQQKSVSKPEDTDHHDDEQNEIIEHEQTVSKPSNIDVEQNLKQTNIDDEQNLNADENKVQDDMVLESENIHDDQNTDTENDQTMEIENANDSGTEDNTEISGTEPDHGKSSAEIGINTGSVTDSASEDGNMDYDENLNNDSVTDELTENGEENGIVINEKDIVTAADMYGRGKRSQRSISNENMSENEDEEGDGLSLRCRSSRNDDSPNKRKYSSPGRRKRKYLNRASYDPELILQPLKAGWRRELVIRNIFDKFTSAGGIKQTPMDVYYHPPKGRKLRSMKEIADHLKVTKSPFTVDNFSLLRRPIAEPPYEVVRNAGKSKGRSHVKGEDDSFDTSLDQPEVVIERADEDEENVENNVTVKEENLITAIPVSSISKRAKIKMTPVRSAFKHRGRGRPPKNKMLPHLTKTKNLLYRYSSGKSSGRGVTETLIKEVTVTMPDFSQQDDEASSTIEPPPAKKFKATARKSTTPKHFKAQKSSEQTGPEALCTLSCPGQENIPPSLQCIVCLCLFHPHCVAFTPTENREFTCLRCYDPAQLQPRTKTLTVMRVEPSAFVSPCTSAPVIKQEPVDPDQSTSTSKEVNPTLLQHLRSSILDRQVVTTIAGPGVPILSPIQSSQTSVIRNSVPSTIANPSPQNLPTLSMLANSGRRAAVLSTVQMSPSGANTLIMPVPGSSLLANAHAVGSTIHMPRLVAPPTHVQYVSQTPTTPSLRTPVLSMMPPRLTAAPKTPPVVLVDANKTSPIATRLTNGTTSQDINGKTGQILTLPGAVTKRLNLQQPLALKINNVQITVPPSSLLLTSDGLKLFLPPKTFPLQMGETAKLSVTVTNDKSNSSQPEVSVNINTDSPDSSGVGNLKPLSGDTVSSTGQSKVNTSTHRSTRWRAGINPGMCYVKKLYGGFDCMFCIFQYLNMKDLLRVAMVCRTWRQLAMHPSHWRNLRLQNLKILNWEKAIDFMLLRAVQLLNLRGLVHSGDMNRTWHQLIPHIHKLSCLRKIIFGLVPASVLHMVSEKMPYLEVFNAETITDVTNEQMWSVPTKLDIGKFSQLTKLQELRLRGVASLLLPSFSFSGGIDQLGCLKNLTTLSLTSLKDIGDQEFGFLANLTKLEVLELGHCSTWSSETYFHLGQLKNLKHLRLESGGEIPDIGFGDALQNMKELEQLELMMFVIAESVHNALGQLPKLSHFAIWPNTSSQPAALVNSHVLAVVSRLAKLKKLEWGIVKDKDKSDSVCDPAELQKKAQEEWIPFLSAGLPPEGEETWDNSSIQLMSVHQFTEKLSIIHPTTHIKVFSTDLMHPNHLQSSEVS